ncbi:MAG: HEAT repeat domain-containing protein [Methanomicrobiaceae archaeon]|uniref:HEAT repeat domain-containing protein n=1 Tax=Methanoculleus sp. TaxID=90427 RepID=UPI00320F67F5|nr:HEAT repeat domain-containing protein [Methanomicrobiaceae archaeon]
MRLTEPVWGRLAVVGLITALSVFLGLAVHALFDTDIAYTHFFYLVLILAAFWYQKRAVYAGILLAALHVVVEYGISGYVGTDTLVRAGMFIVVSYLLGYLFELSGRRANGLHLHIGEPGPGAPACDRDTRRLIARLASRDPDTRYEAAGCLGDSGEPAAVGPLAALLRDPESGVRWKATEALGKLGSPAVVPLIESLQSENVDVRWMAAIALGDIGDPGAVPALVEALNDEDTYVRSRAALALAAIGEPAREDLISSLRAGNSRVRVGVALALGRLGGENSVVALIDALRDPNEEVQQRAASALGDISEPAVPSLLSALRTDEEGLRQGVIAALGQIGRPAVASLALALGADDWRVRRGAAAALGEINDPGSVDALIEALDDGREEVRQAARQALGGIRRHNTNEGAPELHD